MKTVRHINTLFYYDGAQVFEARDGIGGHYIAVMIEPEDTADRYLVVGVSPERLRQFRGGTTDLRSIVEEGAEFGWYLTSIANSLDQPLDLAKQEGPISETDFLPEPGFVLYDNPALDEAFK